MERRIFVKLSAFTAAIITLPLAHGCASGKAGVESQPIFFSHLADAKTIAAAGKAYLALRPGESNSDKLKAILLPSNEQATDVNNIARSLSVRVKNDFQAGDTVTVSGWVLARTEARQCALFYLSQS
jgi:hypothetical protein